MHMSLSGRQKADPTRSFEMRVEVGEPIESTKRITGLTSVEGAADYLVEFHSGENLKAVIFGNAKKVLTIKGEVYHRDETRLIYWEEGKQKVEDFPCREMAMAYVHKLGLHYHSPFVLRQKSGEITLGFPGGKPPSDSK